MSRAMPAILMLFLAWAGGAPAQESFTSLEERMTGKEFEGAGLDKLSEEELARLNAWIRRNVSGSSVTEGAAAMPAPGGAGEDRRGFPADEDKSEIITTIPGHFTGWNGKTVFELENGQVWRQTSGGSYRVSMDDPTVVIYPTSFGGWRLRLQEYGPSIGVRRVK